MRRRDFVALVGGALASPIAWPHAARAQQAAKVPHVVFFSPFGTDDIRVHSFRQGLSDLGRVDGKDISIEYVRGRALPTRRRGRRRISLPAARAPSW